MRSARRAALVVALLVPALAPAAPPAPAADAAARFRRLVDEDWEARLRESPTFATEIGDRRYDTLLDDLSPTAIEAHKARQRALLASLRALDRAALPPAAQLDYDLLRREVELAVEGQRFPTELLLIDQIYGPHTELASLAEAIPRDRVEDLDHFIARLEAFPRYLDQVLALLGRGIQTGVTPPQIVLRDLPRLIDAHIVDDPTRSPVYQLAFAQLPASFSAADKERLQSAARRAIADKVVPAMKKLRTFIAHEYLPHAREAVGMSALPDGRAWYAWRARLETTTLLAPDAIHELGLSEVRRIRGDMEAVMRETGWKGTLPEFFRFLRTDRRFFFTDKDALVVAYRDLAKRIDPELPHLFGRLPRLPYGVRPVPAHSERTQTTAYYQPGSPEAGRAGYYCVNTYNLPSRPKWEMEALTLHESVPGHHLQISLAQELGELPAFRRHAGFTAFVEGWALYAESLGRELGLYVDAYARFGQLTYEMWRAVRLVVDTGMHWKGWSRDQAIRYFLDNAGKTEHDIVVEVDRYIVWPGQALAYKIGQLKIRELRRRAEAALGPAFDVRAFHDLVLGAGALPLDVLEGRVTAWLANSAAARPAPSPR